jgi:hypothetical protein
MFASRVNQWPDAPAKQDIGATALLKGAYVWQGMVQETRVITSL